MKKNNFLEGAMIATISIIVCKIIGLFYVIPFKHIIGEQGGALYGYAYSIYAIFLSLSSSGIPIAMSKIVSEYNTLGYNYTKEKAYKIGQTIIVLIGLISFLIMIIFAPQLAKIILGDLEGGNTIEGVSMVIRVVSSALLIVPLLSVKKGYLQGHRFITPSSISNIIDQIVRVLIIIFGSFFALKVFNQSIETAVGIAVFGATAGGISAYFYLFTKLRKNKESLNKDALITRAEAKITTKELLKKIVMYALPFIIIDLIKSAFAMVDTFTVVNTMAKLGYSEIAETIIGVLNVWGTKLNMIVISLAIGLTISLIPNLASSFVSNNLKEVSRKINQSLQIIVFISLPMTIGLSFLSHSVWTVFYGYNDLSIKIYSLFAFQALIFSVFSILIDSSQTLNNTKLSLGALGGSFLGKAFLNIPMMKLFSKFNLGIYYAPVVTSLLVQFIAIVTLMFFLNKKYQINYNDFFKSLIKIILISLIMLVSLKIISSFYILSSETRLGALIEVIVYSLIGAVIYIVIAYKSKLLEQVLGQNFLTKIKNKIKKPF